MKEAIQNYIKNLKELPKTFEKSLVRHDKPTSDRARSQVVFSNFFLHGLSTRIHRYSLKNTYTFGLGVIALSSFLILCVTGIILMVYYKPSKPEIIIPNDYQIERGSVDDSVYFE